MNELIGKYLNGFKIVKIEQDPFIKGQVNLWTDDERIETFGDRTITKFFVRDDSNSNKIYQELVDKEKYELQQRINKAIEYIEETPIGSILEVHCGEEEEYTEPLLVILKGDEENDNK